MSREPRDSSAVTRALWAFDVSTSWHYRRSTPVGITRTEVEYGRCVCRHHKETLLTVYDRRTRSHRVLPVDDAQDLLGSAPSQGAPATNTRATSRSHPSIRQRLVASLVEAAWATNDLLQISSLSLALLLLLPFRSSIGARLNRQVLHRREELADRRFLSRLPKLAFSEIENYITVGCGWDMNDLEAVYHHKQEHGFNVTTCVYDIAPIVMPDVVSPRLNESFPPYLYNLLWASDSVACISQAAQDELEELIRETGAPHPHIEVCQLGSTINDDTREARPHVAEQLRGRPFALYVATYEPRKNHEFLYFLWNELVRGGGVDPIPLVLAGRRGWRTDDLLERIRLNTHLYPEYIALAEGLSDAEIAWLYRNCRFTVFPSLHEGWGLPVSESLSHGKFCIASDRASLPEAGQGLIRNIDLLDGRAWLDEIKRCLSDDEYLRGREGRIAGQFRRRTWEEAGADFLTAIARTNPESTAVASVTGRAA